MKLTANEPTADQWSWQMISDVIGPFMARTNDIFEMSLREKAQPPIKGNITKGKIKWRGIKIVRTMDGNGFTEWIEQRGERISPIIQINKSLGSLRQNTID